MKIVRNVRSFHFNLDVLLYQINTLMAYSNMATHSSNFQNLQPVIFDGSSDLETFIQDAERYFRIAEISEEKQIGLIMNYLARNLWKVYKGVKTGTFDERLRKAFNKPNDLIQDFKEALHYRRNGASTEEYVRSVEENVSKIMRHKIDSNELTIMFLLYGLDDRETRKEIRYKDAKTVPEITTILKNMENAEMTETVTAQRKPKDTMDIAGVHRKRTFADVMKEKSDFHNRQPKRVPQYIARGTFKTPNKKTEAFECWSCGQHGHISRNCSNRKPKVCFGCGQPGHIRRECPQRPPTSCGYCKKRGHRTNQCFRRKAAEFDKRYGKEWPKHVSGVEYESSDSDSLYQDDTEDVEFIEVRKPQRPSKNGVAPSQRESMGAINVQ